MQFEWDREKATSNVVKHGVTFEEAQTVFGDPFHTTIFAPDAPTGEERWLTTGTSEHGRLIIVWHTNRGDAIRIIGARLATANERRIYESGE